MRPLTDRLKISREKLAYIVDSTAAPVASIAFVTTWIGAELGYIGDGISGIENGVDLLTSPYAVFFQSLQYAFYPILTLFFMFVLIWKQRDFGAMHKAEVSARNRPDINANEEMEIGDVDEIIKQKEHTISALLPILVLLSTAVAALIITGHQVMGWDIELSTMKNIAAFIGAADAYNALLWASFAGLTSAILITVIPRILGLRKTLDHAIDGIKIVIPAIVILGLAWTLSEVTEQLHTADYLASLVSGWLSPHFLPVIVFVLAAVIAFSTGTSWGTMSILYPMVLATSWQLSQSVGFSTELSISIFAAVVASVLAGSVLGDHCSPISDTTILSSLASECDHIAHVRTQLPYALTVGGVSILFGLLPAGFGWPWYITFPFSLLILYLIVSYLGKRVPQYQGRS